jgi:hypothetical protein
METTKSTKLSPTGILSAWNSAGFSGRGKVICPADIRKIDIGFERAPTELDIVERCSSGLYQNRYELLRDLMLNLSWANRYAIPLYEKRPVRWGDIPRDADDVFLPVYQWWHGAELAAIIVDNYRWLAPAWDEETEDVLFEHLIALFRGKPSSGAELSPLKPTVGEALADGNNHVLAIDNHNPNHRDLNGDDIGGARHPVAALEELMRHAMLLGNQYPWNTADSYLCPIKKMHKDDHVVLFYAKNAQAANWLKKLRNGYAIHAIASGRPAPALLREVRS